MSVKSENQIWADVITFFKGALTAKGTEGWNVRQSDQPTIVGFANQTIYIERISSRRYGWQSHRNEYDDELQAVIHKEEYYQEILFQVSAFKKRDAASIEEETSADILNSIITYVQSIDGVKALQALGYQSYRIIEQREPAIVNDSERYEKIPSLDISLVLLQTEESQVGGVDKFTGIMKGI